MPEFIEYTVTDHIATVTLNRPETMNALNRQMYAELEQAFRDALLRCVRSLHGGLEGD